MRALSRRERGVYQEAIPRLIGELCAYVCPAEGRQPAAKMAGPIMFICHDEEYREADADIEVAIPIIGSVNLEGGAGVVTLPGGKFVSVLHTGPYPGVGKAYERLFSYMNEHRLVPAGPSRELYLNDPAEVPGGGTPDRGPVPGGGPSPVPLKGAVILPRPRRRDGPTRGCRGKGRAKGAPHRPGRTVPLP
ncbi:MULTISPECIES: GyrI-like domain-containing protein [unclassified Methanoculleus]|uniref:GyrI-like domain-containing protein n=1 Tax=unclassified Methanoculleus TaxID=2619537 RepID=UPI0025F9D916|nr:MULTISPECIES: GyrI-like domain-containing protein [unclassified Methanoculleus]